MPASLGDASWVAELVGSFLVQALLLAVLGVGLSLARRSWRWAAIGAALALAGGSVASSDRSWRPLPTPSSSAAAVLSSWGSPDRAGTPGPLRLCIVNTHPENTVVSPVVDALERAGPDVVVLLETGGVQRRGLASDGRLLDRYAFRTPLEGTGYPRVTVLSRWPVREAMAGGWSDELDAWGRMRRAAVGRWEVIVAHPSGEVAILAAHPPSPRTAARWADGLEGVSILAARAAMLGARLGVPVVVASDLNGLPWSARGRALRGAGLRPAKPLTSATGTFPSGVAWPARLHLDDAWVCDRVRVTAWGTLAVPGSDHLGVVVDLALPSGRGAASGAGWF